MYSSLSIRIKQPEQNPAMRQTSAKGVGLLNVTSVITPIRTLPGNHLSSPNAGFQYMKNAHIVDPPSSEEAVVAGPVLMDIERNFFPFFILSNRVEASTSSGKSSPR